MLKAQANKMYWQCHAVIYCHPFCREKWAFQSNTTVLVQKSFTAPVGAGTSLKVGIMSEDWNEPKKGKRSKGRKSTETKNFRTGTQ